MKIEPLEHRIAPASLAFAFGVGAGGTQTVSDVATDSSGNTYVAGTFVGSVDFDPGPAKQIRTAPAGDVEAFIAKYTSTGALAWVNLVASEDGHAFAPELAISDLGEVFFTAPFNRQSGGEILFTESTLADPTLTLSPTGSEASIYVAKIDSTGHFVWRHGFSGSAASLDSADIAVTSTNEIFVSGNITNGPLSGVQSIGSDIIGSDPGETDAFVFKMFDDPTLNVAWARDTTSSGLANVGRFQLAVDGNSVVLAGTFSGTIGVSGQTVTASDAEDIFIGRLNGIGTWGLAVSISGGGVSAGGLGEAVGIAVGNSGEIIVAGDYSGSADFDPSGSQASRTSAGERDLFILTLDSGGDFQDVRSYGGANEDRFLALARHGNQLTLASLFEKATDFPFSEGRITFKSVGPDDAILLTLGLDGSLQQFHPLAADSSAAGKGLLVDQVKGGGIALAGDNRGGVVVGGAFRGTFDADYNASVKNLKSKGGADVFVARYFPDGRSEQSLFQPALEQAFALGGGGSQVGNAVATDDSGNIILAGFFQGTVDFDPGKSILNLTASDPGGNIFVAKYSPSGSLFWARQIDAILPSSDPSVHVAVSGDDVYLAGEFEVSATIDSFFLPNADASPGFRDVFVTKLNDSGVFQWAVSAGGAGSDEFVDALAVTPDGFSVIAGTFGSTTDFHPGPAIVNRTPVGSADGYVLSLDSSGGFDWVTQIAPSGFGFAELNDLAINSSGQVFVVGAFLGSVDLNFGNSPIVVTSASGALNGFVAKYDPEGGSLISSAVLGSNFSASANAIAINDYDEVFVGGDFEGELVIDTLTPMIESGGRGGGDAFLLKFDSSLSLFDGVSFGGPGSDRVVELGVDGDRRLFAAGVFAGTVDFDPGAGLAKLTSTTQSNLFISRFESSLTFLSAFQIQAFDSGEQSGTGLNLAAGGNFAVDFDGHVYFTGSFVGTLDADVSAGKRSFTSKGGLDLVFAEFSPVDRVDATHVRSFHDADGDLVTIRLTGPGSLSYALFNHAGDFENASFIELFDTTLATTLTVTVQQQGTGSGTTQIDQIIAAGTRQHLGSIFLSDNILLGPGFADSDPDLLITGASRSLHLGDLNTGTLIKLGQDLPYNVPNDTTTPDTYNHHPDLTIDEVVDNDVVIEVTGDGTAGGVGGGGLGKVVIGRWAHLGFIRTTQSIGSVTVLNGDFLATLEVDKNHFGEETTANVGTMTVQDGAWGSGGNEIEGNVSAFNADAFLAGASITAGSIGKVTITGGSFDGTLILTNPVAGGTNVFTVGTDFTGSVIAAAPLKSIKVKGDFKGSLKAPTIGAITAFSFFGATTGDLEGDPLRRSIVTTDGPVGLIRATIGSIVDYELVSAGGFGGFTVKLAKLSADTVGLDRVSIQAASIGKITVSLAAAKTSEGVNLIGIRDSQFVTTGTATKGVLRGSIGAVNVTVLGSTNGADAAGIRTTLFDALVNANEFGTNPASTANLLTNFKVTVKNQDGASIGLDAVTFLGDSIGTTTVVVTRGKDPAATARAANAAHYFSDGSIGALLFDGDATMTQVTGLEVLAGASVGPLTVKAKTTAMGTLDNSRVLAGQSLDLSGATDALVKAALAKANLGAVKVTGDLTNSLLGAGASIGAVNIGGALTGSLLLAGARLGGDFAIDGDESWQRAAAIAAVTVKGFMASSFIVAGVDPVNGVFGDANDVAAPAAGALTQTSVIGPVTFTTADYVFGAASLAAHQASIQAAAIKSIKLTAGVFTDFTIAQYLDLGAPGEDAGDIVIRLTA